ncbi:MAG: VOC family protein [Candidatus Hodarchaeales archaeon]|jgi:predicted lactoylglutathione lyase
MAGIVFLKTRNIEKLKDFYTTVIGATVWIDQKDCIIFKHDNFLFGFCERSEEEESCLLTFFYKKTEEVDKMYKKLIDLATSKPEKNEKYSIYQFYAHDPDGRNLEFQAFLHEINFNWNTYN